MRVLDISYAQDPVNVGEMAKGGDAVIVRWTDWAARERGEDADYYYNHHLAAFRRLGLPTTGYLYPRPGTSAGRRATVQIDTWAQHTTETFDFSPMLDLEESIITGQALQDWVEEALTRMKQVWGFTPLYYFAARLAAKLGTWRPTADHLLMVPGYPYRDLARTRYPWGQQDRWIDNAGGPGTVSYYLPPGYRLDEVALWQYASTANVPGTGNSVDVSHAYPPFVDQAGTLGPAIVKELFTVAQFEDLMGAIGQVLAVSTGSAKVQDGQHLENRKHFADLAAVTIQAAKVQDSQHIETRGGIATLQAGVNGSYANLSAQLAAFADTVAAGVAAKLGTGVVAPIDLEAIRAIVREELAGLRLEVTA